MELRHLHKLPLPFSSSPSIPLVTCRFGDAYKRRRYSTPPRRRQRVVPSASNAFLGADGSIAALRTMAIAAACAPSIHKPLRPFGHAGQGWVSAAKYARLPRCGCRQLVRGVRRAVVRLPRLPATLFCTSSALRHWAAYWQTRGASAWATARCDATRATGWKGQLASPCLADDGDDISTCADACGKVVAGLGTPA